MTTYADAEVALAVRGALFLGWERDTHGYWMARDSSLDCDDAELLGRASGFFFVALLDKCDAAGIEMSLFNRAGDAWVAYIGPQDDPEWGATHANRTLALLLALDAAKPDGWPKEDA